MHLSTLTKLPAHLDHDSTYDTIEGQKRGKKKRIKKHQPGVFD
jgi:hypothetical protein